LPTSCFHHLCIPPPPPAFPKRVLIMSPHPDDDVISMGGTLTRLLGQGHEVGAWRHWLGQGRLAWWACQPSNRPKPPPPPHPRPNSYQPLPPCLCLYDCPGACRVPDERQHRGVGRRRAALRRLCGAGRWVGVREATAAHWAMRTA
jgi:hypothetical protein